MKFLQIGVHIGNDEAFEIIKNHKIELGILVEPLPHLIPHIQKNYSGIENINIENKAIAINNCKNVSFFYDTGDPITELSSMSKQHLLEHHVNEENIKEIQVETESLNSILERYSITDLDYLFIDTEGFDYDILMSLNLQKYNIQNIIFEDIHMDGTGKRGIKYKTLTDKLISEGYSIEKYNNNNTRCIFKNNIHIIYRTSDTGYNKVKPNYVNNVNCLSNAIATFPTNKFNWHIIADNISESTNKEIHNIAHSIPVNHVSVGNGAGTFNLALDYALTLPDDNIVYFLENDYIHRTGSYQALISALIQLQPSFVSLYDHPDKYIDPSLGGNPHCEGGAEDTRVYLINNTHWKITNSTTMTFAATVKTLKRVEHVFRKWTNTTHPYDFEMFMELRELGEILISPIPGFSTHGETQWLAPTINWETLC
jgi:FkbM family methyltransferase